MRYLLPLLVALVLTAPAIAQQIDLSTVPPRDGVQLTIYNNVDLTLVRETRTITFQEGVNPLQFSWANTLIDPTSVQIEFPGDDGNLRVLDTTYPHDRPQVLYWNIAAEQAGNAQVQITYFTSGINWSADYTVIANPDETTLRVEGFVTVTNHSGEDYDDAQVRLVVGNINLVERIAELARRQGYQEREVNENLRRQLLRQASQLEMLEAADMAPMAAPAGEAAQAPPQIIREGLSEYFIFTIDGVQTVPTGWSRRIRSFDAADAPTALEYRYRPREYGNQLVRLYLLTHDDDAGMPEAPLPNGTWRVFRQREGGGLSYLGQQDVRYIPLGDEVELNLGPDPHVVFSLTPMYSFRDNIWANINGRVIRRIDQPGVQIEDNSRVIGWDQHLVFDQHIRNNHDRPITVEVRRMYNGDVEFISQLDPERYDANTVEYTLEVPANEAIDRRFETVQSIGHNQAQRDIELTAADPATPPWLPAD